MRNDRNVRNLDDLVVFAQVVERRSITAAAKALRMSPSAVSRRLARLEESLHLRLINRSTHHMSLTEGGRVFYRHCARGLAEFDLGMSVAEDLNEETSGLLRIHASLGVGQCIVAPAIIDFAKAYPNIRIELNVSDTRVNLLEQNLDVSIRGKAFTDEGLSNVVSIDSVQLFSAPYVICAAPEYLAANQPLDKPSDLVAHNCLIHTTQITADEWWFTEDDRDVKVRVHGSLITNNGTAVYQGVLRGLGIGRLPHYRVSEDIAAGRLKPLFIDSTKSDRSIKAYYSRMRRLPAKLRLFLTFLSKRLAVQEYRGDHAA
jgi:DNA-binding transcriptional LysR family regulator